ncbi:MAG: nuclear transport factor 2 family protein [Verrucomicrobiota bacterium]|nr:nuclear transport factor 2 family protein [Verrucomicrobiota bacterium]
MKKLVYILIFAAAFVGGYFVTQWLFPGAEKIIKSRLEKLASDLSNNPGEGGIKKLAAANRITSYFTSDVLINTEGFGRGEPIQGREEMTQMFMAARGNLRGTVKIYDVKIDVAPDGKTATSNFAAMAELQGQSDPFVQVFRVQWRKEEKQWLIQQVDPVREIQILTQ